LAFIVRLPWVKVLVWGVAMPIETFVQPSLQDLAARLLAGRADAHASGLAVFDLGDVTPYEAGPVQPIEPQSAWREAVAALSYDLPPNQVRGDAEQAPPHWPQLVANHEPMVALAFCVGNFPQLVRNFHQILQSGAPASFRPDSGRPDGGRITAAPQLVEWAHDVAAKKQFPTALIALGALRLAKQFDEADRFTTRLDGVVPAAWRPAWDNEKAALAWTRGDVAAARALWSTMASSLPVRFNRAMAELFSGNAQAAGADFADVVKELPESSAWHHLACLYLTLASMR